MSIYCIFNIRFYETFTILNGIFLCTIEMSIILLIIHLKLLYSHDDGVEITASFPHSSSSKRLGKGDNEIFIVFLSFYETFTILNGMFLTC